MNALISLFLRSTVAFLWFLFSVTYVLLTWNESSIIIHNTLVILIVFTYVLCVIKWINCGNRFLSLFVFFTMYLMLSNIGQSIIYLFPGTSDFLSVYHILKFTTIVYTLQFQFLCVSAYYLGVCGYLSYKSNVDMYYIQKCTLDNNSFKSKLSLSEKLLMFIFVVSLIYSFKDAISFLFLRQTMGYGDAYALRFESGTGGMKLTFNWISIVLGYRFIFKRLFVKPIIIAFLLLSIIYIVCGNRSLSLSYLSILAITVPLLYPSLFVKKLIPVWIVFFVFFLILLGIVAEVRNGDFSDLQNYESSSVLLSFAQIISEIGSAQFPLGITIDAIQSGFSCHQTLLYFFITAFSSSSIADMLGLSQEYLPLGEWAGNYVGIFNYGIGYSCIAEWYMNYGWFGFAFSFFYGWFIVYAECTAYKKMWQGKFYVALALLSFLTHSIFLARSNMFYSLFFVRYAFLLIILNNLCKLVKNKYYLTNIKK